MEKILSKFILTLILLVILSSCMQDGEIIVSMQSKLQSTTLGSIAITDVSIINNQLIIHGPNLAGVNQIKVKDNSAFEEDFTIESNTTTEIIANGQRAISFLIDHSFDLLISSAEAAATYNVLFTLSNHSVALTKLNVTGVTTGQFVKYDGTDWVPGDAPWVVNGADVSRASGKVGIGTSSPVNALSVRGSMDTVLNLTSVGVGASTAVSYAGTAIGGVTGQLTTVTSNGSVDTPTSLTGHYISSRFTPTGFNSASGTIVGADIYASASGFNNGKIIGTNIQTYSNSVSLSENTGLKIQITPTATSTTSAFGIDNKMTQTSGTVAKLLMSSNTVRLTGGGSPFVTDGRGVFSELLNDSASGSIITGYGVYIGSVQATNKWALYSEDNTAKSYFAGRVGVGIATPGYALEVNGTIAPTGDGATDLGAGGNRFRDIYAANAVINTSDKRMKKEIAPSNLGLDFIMGLKPVSYYWKRDNDVFKHYGFIAQELKASAGKNADGIVVHDKKSDMYGLRYTELISPIVKAIQEFVQNKDKQMSEVEMKVARLEHENLELNERIKKLEQEMLARK